MIIFQQYKIVLKEADISSSNFCKDTAVLCWSYQGTQEAAPRCRNTLFKCHVQHSTSTCSLHARRNRTWQELSHQLRGLVFTSLRQRAFH